MKDLQTDIADHQASTKKMKEEFAEMLQEIKLAREAKAEHEQTAATLVEVTAELQKAKAAIEVRGRAVGAASLPAQCGLADGFCIGWISGCILLLAGSLLSPCRRFSAPPLLCVPCG